MPLDDIALLLYWLESRPQVKELIIMRTYAIDLHAEDGPVALVCLTGRELLDEIKGAVHSHNGQTKFVDDARNRLRQRGEPEPLL